ncbi:hypothetical protein NSQ54_13860 [Alkalihalobacillus sp. FSL W8-0930]
MEEKKRSISFQFSKDGTGTDLRDKHKPQEKKKKPETEWVFPEPDHVVEKNPPVPPSKEENREIFLWDETKKSDSTKKKPTIKKQSFTSFYQKGKALPWALVAAVASAILIGISLGFVTLTVTNGGVTQDPSGEAVDVSTTPAPPVDPQASEPSETEFYVIQGGAFSTSEASKQVSETFKKDGFPVTIESGGDAELLYIATAGTKEEAIQLVELYKEAGHDAFVKKYEFPALTGEQTEVGKWFNQAGVNIAEVAEASAKNLSETTYGDAEMTALTQQLTQLENQRDAMMESATEEVKASAQTVMAKLAESSQLLQGETEDVWKAQQLILDIMPIYKKSMEDLNENE